MWPGACAAGTWSEPAKISTVSLAVASTIVMGSTLVTISVISGVLIALGVFLSVVGIRLVRATRTDPAALGPLEVMGERRWQRSDSERRDEALAGARATPLEPPAEVAAPAVAEVVAVRRRSMLGQGIAAERPVEARRGQGPKRCGRRHRSS